MKFMPFAAIILGVAAGLFFPTDIPSALGIYVAVSVLVGFDSVFGGLCAYYDKNFKTGIFLTGLFFNLFVALAMTYVGKLMGIDLYIAAIVVFGARIVHNLSVIRRNLSKLN